MKTGVLSTGEDILQGMEEALRLLPTSRLEISTITDSLNSPTCNGWDITDFAVNLEGEVLSYWAGYYDEATDAHRTFSVERQAAVLILDVALLYFRYDHPEDLA